MRRRHQLEADDFLRRRGLTIPNLIMPSSTAVTSPIFSLPVEGLSNSFSLVASQGSQGPLSSSEVMRQVDNNAAVQITSEKPRKLFADDLFKYLDFSRMPAATKLEAKKSLNELKQEQDLSGWESPVTDGPSSCTDQKSSGMENMAESCEHACDNGSVENGLRSNIEQQQQQQILAGSNIGGFSLAQNQQQTQQLSQQMSQLSAMLSSASFSPYFCGYHGPYTTFPAAHGHAPFPLLTGNAFVMPPGQSQVHSFPAQVHTQASSTEGLSMGVNMAPVCGLQQPSLGSTGPVQQTVSNSTECAPIPTAHDLVSSNLPGTSG